MSNPLLRPDEAHRSVLDIDFRKLSAQGIRFCCFDLDNTLAPQGGDQLIAGVKERVCEIREQQLMKEVCLISNVIWGKRRVERLARIARELEIEHYYPAMFWDKKPGPKPFRWALDCMNSDPRHTCMVGDQIFSDVLGGNRHGMYTILVKSFSPDHWTTLWTGRRRREKKLFEQFNISF